MKRRGRAERRERERWINGGYFFRETLLRKGRWESRGETGSETDSPEKPQVRGAVHPDRAPGLQGGEALRAHR